MDRKLTREEVALSMLTALVGAPEAKQTRERLVQSYAATLRADKNDEFKEMITASFEMADEFLKREGGQA
jgi:hypothetical protein